MFDLTILRVSAFANATLLTAQQVRDLLTISPATLRRWRSSEPDFPPAIQLGPRRIAFRADDVNAYIARRAGDEPQSFG